MNPDKWHQPDYSPRRWGRFTPPLSWLGILLRRIGRFSLSRFKRHGSGYDYQSWAEFKLL